MTLALITMSFDLSSPKLFEDCDFVFELYKTHEIPRDEIYKHFCIANTLHTTKNSFGFIGIYAIGSEWWCGETETGGGCNVKCSDLVDDDIADDVRCANAILSQQGLQGWHKTEESCKIGFLARTNECLATIEVLEALQTNSTKPPWMFGTSTLTPPQKSAKPITTERLATTTTSTEKASKKDEQRSEPVPECSCRFQNILITLIALSLLVLVIIVSFKYQSLKRYLSTRAGNHEYENSLVI